MSDKEKVSISKYQKELNDKKQIYLKTKIIPGSSESEIKDIMADQSFRIAIKAPAEKGKANAELIKFLAKEFETEKANIKIISGKTERIKLIKIIKTF